MITHLVCEEQVAKLEVVKIGRVGFHLCRWQKRIVCVCVYVCLKVEPIQYLCNCRIELRLETIEMVDHLGRQAHGANNFAALAVFIFVLVGTQVVLLYTSKQKPGQWPIRHLSLGKSKVCCMQKPLVSNQIYTERRIKGRKHCQMGR